MHEVRESGYGLLGCSCARGNLTVTAVNPAPAPSFTTVNGGFAVNGLTLPRVTTHLKGKLPDGATSRIRFRMSLGAS
jgi:hypothetical protein